MTQLLILLLQLIQWAVSAYTTILLIYALMSWLPGASNSKFGYLIARLSEPYLDIFRRLIPPLGMVSFSVLAGILFLRLVEYGAQVIIIFLIRLLN